MLGCGTVGVTQDLALYRNDWRMRTLTIPRIYGKGHQGEHTSISQKKQEGRLNRVGVRLTDQLLNIMASLCLVGLEKIGLHSEINDRGVGQ